MTEPYRYKDKAGDFLVVGEHETHPGCVLVKAVNGVCVPPDKVAAIALALYEAAGLPAPLILDRSLLLAGSAAVPAFVAGFRLWTEGGRAFVAPHRAAEGLTPETARHLAAAIVKHADEAATEPDPADVQSLALAMRGALSAYGSVPLPQANVDEVAAHAALRWMRERES